MNFDLPSEDDPRRLEVRAWFEAHPETRYSDMAKVGYVVPHWPKPWGLNAEPELQIIISEEISRAGVHSPTLVNPVAVNNCAQSLVTHGTPEQQERFLMPALAAEEIWCMLFSEPSGGSDLGALRTTASLEGDYYVVNGQKMWTSLAHKAQIGVLVARTDSKVRKHAGLSEFLVDMDSPGITIRPIIDMSGEANEYNEVFFDDVKVPVDRLLGKEGQGWELAMGQLRTERVALSKPGGIWGAGPTARDLVEGLIASGGMTDPIVRDEAAKIYIEGEIMRLLGYRSLSDRINARPPGPESAARKAIAAPHGQQMLDLAKRWQGMVGLVAGEEAFAPPNNGKGTYDNWDYSFWFSPAVTLGVGTQEILLNVIAERVLGLPREKDPTAKTPWSELSSLSASSTI